MFLKLTKCKINNRLLSENWKFNYVTCWAGDLLLHWQINKALFIKTVLDMHTQPEAQTNSTKLYKKFMR